MDALRAQIIAKILNKGLNVIALSFTDLSKIGSEASLQITVATRALRLEAYFLEKLV